MLPDPKHGESRGTFLEAIGYYLQRHSSRRHTDSSRRRFIDTAVAFSKFLAADMLIGAVTEDTVERWVIERKRAGVAPMTINTDLARLSAFFSFLVRRKWVTENPAKGISREPVDPPRLDQLVTVDQTRAFLAWLTENRKTFYSDLVALGVEIGGRLGELLRIVKAEDVDLKARKIIFRVRGTTGPKRRRERVAMLNANALRLVSRRMLLCGPWLLGKDDGTQILVSSACHGIKRLAKKAGLPQAHMHLFRHLWSSRTRPKLSPADYGVLAGHSAETARTTYTHPALMDLPIPPEVL